MRVPTGLRAAFRPLLTLVLLGGAGFAGMPATAQTTSFTLIGHIEAFSLANATDPLSEATMTVRGIAVTLPRNLLITMPGRYLTASDLFRGPGLGATVRGQSGLALRDTRSAAEQARFVPFEAEVIGNQVGERHIAGVVRISQGALHAGAGYIQSIDPQTGEMRVGIHGGTGGVRVRLNDPTGIFGPPSTGLDARFAVDDGNAPVHARTGFPVCLRAGQNAQRCQVVNRPAGNPHRFTCGTIPAVADALAVACDPRLPVALQPGDHVTYVGMIVADLQNPDPAKRGYVVAAHGLDAELGIYTSPGVDPAYLFVEEAIQGTKGEPFPDIAQEETTRFRIVGFTTDPSRNVEVWLVDSDRARPASPPPPSGAVPPPPVMGASMAGPVGLTPSNGPQLGRFRNTWPAKDNARAVRRDVLVRIVGGQNNTGWGSNGLGLAFGTYTAPIGEYIYPEATLFGVGRLPPLAPPVPFENFCFLTLGGGRYQPPGGGSSIPLGPLAPFPSSGRGTQSQLIGSGLQRACDGQ